MKQRRQFYWRMWLSGAIFMLFILSFRHLQDKGPLENFLLILLMLAVLGVAPLGIAFRQLLVLLGLRRGMPED